MFKRKYVLHLVCMLSLTSVAYPSDFREGGLSLKPPSYQGVFTTAIYDQSEPLAKLKPRIDAQAISEAEVNQTLLDYFYKQKEEQVCKKILQQLSHRINTLREEETSESKKEFWREVAGSVAGIVGGVGSISAGVAITVLSCGTAAPVGAAAVAGGMGALGVVIGTPAIVSGISTAKGGLDSILASRCASPELRRLRSELDSLKALKQQYVDGLRTEAISAFEEDYVKKKRTMEAAEIKNTVENTLIDLRNSTTSAAFIFRELLEKALSLPHGPKVLLGEDHDAGLTSYAAAFDADPFFNAFDAPVKEALRKIVLKIAEDSVVPDTSSIPVRGTYSFHGRIPGCGKTSAAKRIAQLLKLPCFLISLRDATDLSVSNLEGVSPYRPDASAGWLITPLLTPDEHGNNYSNPILIIDEIDKAFSNPTAAAAALNVLLHYLDSGTDSMGSPYFRDRIKINRMTIILTGNEPLTAEALISRLTQVIEFSPLSSSQIRPILEKDLADLQVARSIPKEYSLSLEPGTAAQPWRIVVGMRDSMNLYGVQGYAPHDPIVVPITRVTTIPGADITPRFSIRDARKVLEGAVGTFKEQLIKLEQTQYQLAKASLARRNNEEAEKAYAAAAFAGCAIAAFEMGELLEQAPARRALAIKWYEKSGERGYPPAARLLATHYQHTAQDKAIKWAKRAAQYDPSRDRFCPPDELATKLAAKRDACYLLGQLLTRDSRLTDARYWLSQAKDMGHTRAQNVLDQLAAVESKVDPKMSLVPLPRKSRFLAFFGAY